MGTEFVIDVPKMRENFSANLFINVVMLLVFVNKGLLFTRASRIHAVGDFHARSRDFPVRLCLNGVLNEWRNCS